MTELHKLDTYDIKTVESFIENEIEESIHIEFKSAGALSKNGFKKRKKFLKMYLHLRIQTEE